MAKEKKKVSSKGRKITLKIARNALKVTVDGKRRLDLSNMGIDTFPKCLLKLAAVEELDLSRNTLKKIPDYIGQFLNLRWLDLHSNQIERLPETIGQLKGLCHLNLCNNRLSSCGIPAEIGRLTSLRSLNLGMNRLDHLPGSITNLQELEELGLFDNLFTAVPESVLCLPALTRLNTKRNPLLSVGEAGDTECVQPMERLYLVREEDLCDSCLRKCKEDRKRLDKWCADTSHVKTRFSGLITPNSIARQHQALWRCAAKTSS
ncbi:leucine-rich repeat-containing protein 18-like [Scleropages formosus]|uniref:Leucine rich repeat containing 18 n=1 Tax=Scleropages formosus TaxID=113540 RepID=A0A0P7X5Y7_SCLFO|nr:leucine-rich repeat-containing protein 18 [Scleropages formosus]KPP72300.1 leucine-rich repeat-containing protein 18-like [Scleropages formosus]